MENTNLDSMLKNLINDKPEEAAVNFHDYMKEKLKIHAAPPAQESTVTDDDTPGDGIEIDPEE
jgi:hypothetical protein